VKLSNQRTTELRILQDAGPQTFTEYATQISAAEGFLPGAVSVFNVRETGAQFSDARQDPVTSTPGFEYTSAYTYAYRNGVPTHVYSVETETDSLSVWEMLPSGKVGKLLDRRSDGEQRMRYLYICVCLYACFYVST
jgi:hypothetical protein